MYAHFLVDRGIYVVGRLIEAAEPPLAALTQVAHSKSLSTAVLDITLSKSPVPYQVSVLSDYSQKEASPERDVARCYNN